MIGRVLLTALLALMPVAGSAQEAGVGNFASINLTASAQTVSDNGSGTAATGTVTVAEVGYVELTCSDTNGCTMTLSESGAKEGQAILIVNVSANNATFAHSSGVQEMDGTCLLSQYDAAGFKYIGDRWVNTSCSVVGSGGGTVTSVNLTVPGIFSVSGGPITTSGTFAVSLVNQNANVVFAGPASGSATTPAFRQIVFDDIADNGCTSGQVMKFDGSDWVCADDAGASSGAPAAAQYLVMPGAADGTLTNERELTCGDGLDCVDAGAGDDFDIAVDDDLLGASFITQTAEDVLTGEQALASLSTGLLKVTTGTGVLSTATAGTDYYAPGGTDVALADGGTGASLSDPGADRILFWDDSASSVAFLTVGSGLSISDTTISATGSATCSAGENPSAVTLTAGAATVDFASYAQHIVSLDDDLDTLTLSNGVAGCPYAILFIQDGSGGHTVTWPSDVEFPNDTTPTLDTTANTIAYCALKPTNAGDGGYLAWCEENPINLPTTP